MSATIKSSRVLSKQQGFTLIEIMIVVAIIAVLAAVAYPSYERYIVKTKRTDMMSEMQNIGLQIESRKLAEGSYSAISVGIKDEFAIEYPRQGDKLYDVTINPIPLAPPDNTLTDKWNVTATPKPTSQMTNDGILTLNYQGIKCRGTGVNKKCGTGDEWTK
ncbi:type IV pilin protein [Psychrobacter sp. DWR1-2-3]|uniref:type IV pilin protein n=1 Tax=Psychrobacter sp. DWR1-2-3 TaxID=2804637 RepID=UPI003CF84279